NAKMSSPTASGRMMRPRRKRLAQVGQKRRLVHKDQRTRSMRVPHSAQKFGLYITGLLSGEAAQKTDARLKRNSTNGHKRTRTARMLRRDGLYAQTTDYGMRISDCGLREQLLCQSAVRNLHSAI